MADSNTNPRAGTRLQSFDEDDIVRYSLGCDVPIVGLVRDRSEYKEMREISLIFGYTLGMNRNRARAMSPPDRMEEGAVEMAPQAPVPGPAPKSPAAAMEQNLATDPSTSPA